MLLPKGVHAKHGRFYLVRRRAGRRQWIALTEVAAGPEALRAALAAASAPERVETIGELLEAYINGGMDELASATRREYERCISARLVPVFGHMRIDALRPSHVARYLEDGRTAGRATLANRERAVLSSAYEWGMRRGHAEHNPVRGVRRNTERASRVYVTDASYLAAYQRATTSLRNLMHVGYLTGLRLVDLTRLRKEWLTPDGIELQESKTGHRRLVLMTPHLRLAIGRALDYSPPTSPYVLVAARGQPWREWAVQSAWKRLAPGFPFRALRAKAATDAQHNVLGHRGQMLARYVRRERLQPVA